MFQLFDAPRESTSQTDGCELLLDLSSVFFVSSNQGDSWERFKHMFANILKHVQKLANCHMFRWGSAQWGPYGFSVKQKPRSGSSSFSYVSIIVCFPRDSFQFKRIVASRWVAGDHSPTGTVRHQTNFKQLLLRNWQSGKSLQPCEQQRQGGMKTVVVGYY